jgi:nucleotide-binding universal stress UspA family protein
MLENSPPSPAVVVGIDGSRNSVEAALWAIDEAVDRDLPLRLLYAIEPSPSSDSRSMTHAFVVAEAAVRYASMAVESAERPVKLEVEIIHGRGVDALVAASRSAAMVCVGALGIDGAGGERVGSTPTALVARAHCPIAIVRWSTAARRESWVATVFDGSAADATGVLDTAVHEAALRAAPLRVLVGRRPMFPEIRDPYSGGERSRLAKAELEPALAAWRGRYPAMDIRAVPVPGSPLNYIARHINSIALVVLGHQPSDTLSELVPHAAVNDVNCSVLVCERRAAL